MKTKNILFVLVCTLLSVHIKAANGDTFTANTSEGDIISFKIISEVDKTVQVGTGTGVCGNPQGSVTIPETVTYSGVDYSVISIGAWAFNYTGVRKVTIPNSITSIGTMAFNNCVFLTAITIPNSVTSIGQNAFSQCSDLSSVTSEIETPFAFNTGAFSGISSSCKLTIPYGKKSAYIAAGWTESVFKGGIMEAESVSPNITFADENVKALCVANWDTNGDGELSEAEAAAVTGIGTVFSGKDIVSFDELQYFTGLKNIYISGFRKCYKLKSIVIPEGVTSILTEAFESCSNLTTVSIPNSVTTISEKAFKGCYNLSGVTIPDNVTDIGEKAFYGCSALTSVTIPNSVTTIDERAFSGCTSLNSIMIPAKVSSIGSEAFSGCSNVSRISVAEGNPYYDSRNNCNAIIQTATNTLITGCSNTSIPMSVAKIGAGSFCNTNITTINIPHGVLTIEACAFQGCSNLATISIPSSVTSIGTDAFYGCTGLTSVHITDLTAWCKISMNSDCSSPLSYAHHLYLNGDEVRNLVIPNSVTTIGGYAFRGCSGLTSVTLPNSVTSIGSYSFQNCI